MCEGNKVILWHIYEKPRFKSDGQEDVTNNQLEMLWPYKEVRHNIINSQSEVKVRSHKIETPPWPMPKKLYKCCCINEKTRLTSVSSGAEVTGASFNFWHYVNYIITCLDYHFNCTPTGLNCNY